MKDPAFLFYAKDFYEGTRTMLPEERACYIDLLVYQHQNGYIPNDLRRLKMYCSGVDEATLQATLEAKFKLCDKGWYNQKLQHVNEERKDFSQRQSINGIVGQFFKQAKKTLRTAQYRNLRDFLKENFTNQEIVNEIKKYENIEASLQAMLEAMLKHIGNADAIANEDINRKGGEGGKTTIAYPFESKDFLQAWEVWKDYKSKELGFKYKTHQSEQAALSELRNKSSGDVKKAIAIIEQSMANGWKGFFELKNSNGNTKKQDQRNSQESIYGQPADRL